MNRLMQKKKLYMKSLIFGPIFPSDGKIDI